MKTNTRKPFSPVSPMYAISSEEILLPARLMTTRSLRGAAQVLLEYLAGLAPECQSGWLALSSHGGERLRPIACLQNPDLLVPLENPMLPAEEARLLYRAYVREKPLSLISPAPSGRVDSFGSHVTTTVQLTTLVVPLQSRHGKLGALLLRFAGPGPDAATRSRVIQTATAGAELLASHLRDELFAALERSKQHWEAAFDSLDALLYIHHPNGELLKVNRALAEKLGASAADLIRAPERLSGVFPPCCAARAVETHLWESRELNGTFEVTRTPVFDRNGKRIGCVHLLRDRTEQLRLEAQVRQNERLAALGELVSGVAHELNNPLTSILTYAERLCRPNTADTLPPARLDEMTRRIGQEAERAAHIVQDLLSFARPQPREVSSLCLNEVAERTVELCREMLQARKIQLRLQLAPSLPKASGNFHDLQRVLLNLIKNAQQALQDWPIEGCITLTTEAVGKSVLLTVSDNGPGIRPEIRQRLLDPFFTTKQAGEGTGLGLSLCYGILRAHKATLEIHSEVGQGASFRMQFPTESLCLDRTGSDGCPTLQQRVSGVQTGMQAPSLQAARHSGSDPAVSAAQMDASEGVKATEDATVRPRRKPAQPTAGSPAEGSGRTSACRVAIIDDEPLIRETLVETLSDADYQVCCFTSPAEALQALETETFDLILSDMKMPGMSGIEFYERLRACDPQAASRILFVTGDMLSLTTQTFLARTACAVLKKPFRQSELFRAIEDLLSQTEQAA